MRNSLAFIICPTASALLLPLPGWRGTPVEGASAGFWTVKKASAGCQFHSLGRPDTVVLGAVAQEAVEAKRRAHVDAEGPCGRWKRTGAGPRMGCSSGLDVPWSEAVRAGRVQRNRAEIARFQPWSPSRSAVLPRS